MSSKNERGRPPIYKSERQRKKARREQNRKAQKKVAADRLEKYSTDPKYRAEVLAKQRESYRLATGSKPREWGPNTGGATKFSTMYYVKEKREWVMCRGLVPQQMADFLGMSSSAFAGWIRTNKVPSPPIKTKNGECIYSVNQANALSKSLRDTLKGRAAFRATDQAAISAAFLAIKNNR